MNPAAQVSTLRSPVSTRRDRLTVTAAYYAAFVGLGLGIAAIGPTLPGLAQHTGTHLSGISFLFTAHNLGYLVGCLVAGHILDRVRGHPVMAGMLIIMAATMFLVPLMPLLWLLTGAVFCLGLSGATLDVGANTLLVWVHRDKVAPYMNGLHAFFGVGTVMAPIIIAQLVLVSGDITWAYWVLGTLLLPMAVWLSRLPSPAAPKESDTGPAMSTDYRFVALIVLLWILYVGAEYSMGGWVFSYAVGMRMADTTTAAYLTSVFWGAFTFARLVGVVISMRVRPRYILLCDFAVGISGVGLILLLPASVAALWIGTVMTGFGMASVIPVILSLAERRMVITGRITSFFFAGASVGGMTLPWIIGQLFEPVGPPVAMLGILVNLTLALLVLLVILKVAGAKPELARASQHGSGTLPATGG